MSKIVFVLGAGASAHCGTPLMDSFLDVAKDLLAAGEVEEAKHDFERVFNAVGNLHATQSKAKLDVSNIETVFTAFEMGRLLKSLPGVEEDSEIDKLETSIKKVIGYTLEKTTKLPNDARTNPFQAYWEFSEVLSSLTKVGRSFSVMTFNYDLGLDYSLYRNALLPDYGLNDIDLRGNSVLYLKLHGSLNWGKCSKCNKIMPYRQFQYTEHRPGTNYDTIPIMSKLRKQHCKACGESLEEDPIIIPPTWNKTALQEEIGTVWQRAAKELKDAENIFVLGYSLPNTDWFFNYLFALGIDMKTILREFHVYNPDQGVEGRFQQILGPGAIKRFRYQKITFEEAVRDLARLYVTAPTNNTIRAIRGG